MQNLYLIVGHSGAGKSTLSNELERRFDFREVWSMTTRPRRSQNERGHRFVSKKKFDSFRDELVAYTEFNGYEYGVTADMLRRNDLYVIDVDGVKYLREHYKDKGIRVIYLDAPEDLLAERMLMRGDPPAAVQARLTNDRKKFANVSTMQIDLSLDASLPIDELVHRVLYFILEEESDKNRVAGKQRQSP